MTDWPRCLLADSAKTRMSKSPDTLAAVGTISVTGFEGKSAADCVRAGAVPKRAKAVAAANVTVVRYMIPSSYDTPLLRLCVRKMIALHSQVVRKSEGPA